MPVRLVPRLSPDGRLARLWLLTAVLVGLLPIVAAVVYDFDHSLTPNLPEILANGDALVLSAALAGGCVYDLMNKKVAPEKEDAKTILVVLAFLLGMGAAVWFVDLRNSKPSDVANVSLGTVVFLAGTVVVCLKGLLLKGSRRVP